MTIHEIHNVETAKLKLKIAKLQLQVSELSTNNDSLQKLNDRLTVQLDDACDRIARLQVIIDDCEERYAIHVERFATRKTATDETETPETGLNQAEILEAMERQYNNNQPETETHEELILEPIDPNETW